MNGFRNKQLMTNGVNEIYCDVLTDGTATYQSGNVTNLQYLNNVPCSYFGNVTGDIQYQINQLIGNTDLQTLGYGALSTRITNNENDISTLNDELIPITTNIAALQTMDVSQNLLITALQGNVSTFTGNITTINSNIGSINSNISSLQSTTSTHTFQISGLTGNVSTINSILAANTTVSIGRVTSGAANVTTSGNLQTGLTFNFVLQPGESIKGDKGEKGDSIKGDTGPPGDATAATISAGFAAAAASAAAAEASLIAADASIAALSTRLDADDAPIATHGTEITTLNTDVDALMVQTTGKHTLQA